MSDQEVTFSALRSLQSPSKSQNRLRTGRTKKPEEIVDKVFQYIQEKHYQNEILRNLSQSNHTVQNCSYLKDQKVESDIKKNSCHRKTGISSKRLPNTGVDDIFINSCKLDEEKWTCCGVTCYYFTTENKTWNRCEQTCQNFKSSLLKINDEDELVP
ncbi:PREDICTED: killer cell lectin-like receptor 2-like [Chrysochloris asiatica]|uniref:Killer cell lectin-like receptor 2-like n=1 Tax=Chrysochloris asiatica TaxID=185453 RepID=A0A9B0X3R6_CHRAS|nr:PREDICTED: killer cell lectin-like receptor 2-like [Chrysochloris asiatica]